MRVGFVHWATGLYFFAMVVAGGARETPDSGSTPNRLIESKSPYLLQHAFNPVDWYSLGRGGVQKGPEGEKTDPSEYRVFDVSLVSRDGKGILPERGGREFPQ